MNKERAQATFKTIIEHCAEQADGRITSETVLPMLDELQDVINAFRIGIDCQLQFRANGARPTKRERKLLGRVGHLIQQANLCQQQLEQKAWLDEIMAEGSKSQLLRELRARKDMSVSMDEVRYHCAEAVIEALAWCETKSADQKDLVLKHVKETASLFRRTDQTGFQGATRQESPDSNDQDAMNEIERIFKAGQVAMLDRKVVQKGKNNAG